jgi:hypothetical protein
MIILNRAMNFKTVIIISLILSQVLVPGCVFNQTNVNSSQPTSVDINASLPAPVTILNESSENLDITDKNQSAPLLKDISVFDSVNITVHSVETKPSGKLKLVILDISMKNEKIKRRFDLNNYSLFCLELDAGYPLYPKTENLPIDVKNPLIPGFLPPGQEKQGTVVFELWENVKSIVLYVKYPNANWDIVGESVVSDISNGSKNNSDFGYPKKLGLIVHSATQQHTLLGWNPPRSSIAVINMSITNHGTTSIRVPREHIFIRSEQPDTLEHGGDRAPPEIAHNYLRFPLSIAPNETKSGSIVYLVYSGTKVNKLILTDYNFVVNSMVDLNDYYVYS